MFTNHNTPYKYEPEISRQLLAEREQQIEIAKKIEEENEFTNGSNQPVTIYKNKKRK